MLQTLQFYLMLGILCLLLPPVFSQNFTDKELLFDQLDKRDGLTNDTFNDFIYKDSRGYLWVSSLQGVYLYDGYDFRLFTPNPNDVDGMIGTNVQSKFYEDEESNIWFSTYQGINKYDVKEDRIFGYTISDKSGNLLQTQYYIFHLDTLHQELWTMVDGRIYKYNYLKNEVVESIGPKMQSIRMSVKLDEAGEVVKIYGAPWRLATGIEMLNYSNNKWKYEKQNLKSDLAPVNVCDFIFANDFVWLISNRGLIKYSNENEIVEIFKLKSTNGSQFMGAAKYGDNQILILSETDGLCVFDLESEQFRLISTQVIGLDNSHLRTLHVDRDDVLWVAIRTSGIGRVDLKAGAPMGTSRKVYEANNLEKVCSNGEIYLLTSDDKFIVLDTTRTHNVLFKDQLTKQMEDVIKTSSGELLFIDRNALYSYDVNNRKLKEEARVNFGLTNICEFKNQVYILSFKGICRWNKNDKTIKPLKYTDDKYNKDGFLVDGLFMGDNEYLTNYQTREFHLANIYDETIEVKQNAPLSNYIYDAVFHQDNWYFVSINGLFLIDQDAKQSKLYYQSFLPEMGFNSIVFCGDDILLGNSNGLYTYSVKDSTLHQINYLLDENLSVIPKGIKHLPNGNLLIAGDQVIYEAEQDILKYEKISPELILKSIEINNRVNKEPNILNTEYSEIELSHNDDFFALDIRSVNKRLELKGEVKYMDSRINQWQSLASGKLSFDNLTPGDFDLSFVALDKRLNASPVKRLKVIVKEPFYKSMGFLLLGALLLGLISYGAGILIGKIKSEKQQRELRLQLTKEQERNRIASMIHDDMGATLSTIQFASEDLSMDIVDKNLKKKADAIQEYAKDLITRMRTNIWALDSEDKSIKDLCRELKKSAFDQIKPLDLQLGFKQNEPLPDIELSGGTCMEVLLIQKESLNNIVKHAQANNILITASLENQSFVLLVSDDGSGIPEDKILGMGLRNMTKRAKKINGKLDITNSNSGVTIKLSFPV